MSTCRSRSAISALFGFGLIGALTLPANALTLTQAGIDAGFTLVPFVSGYNFGGNYGPLAQGILPNGNVVTGSVGDGKIYVFQDTNNQTLGNAVAAVPYVFQTGNPNFAVATAGGQAYGAQLFGGTYVKFANDGTFTPLVLQTPLTNFLGMWGNPVNGNIITASSSGLAEINPGTGAVHIINSSLFPDGVSVSLDGTKVFIANGGAVQTVDAVTGAVLKTFNVGHSPDGTGVISGGLFDGFIVVNNNDGTVGLIDPNSDPNNPVETIIANQGSRGDFVSADTTNGTLFLSQIESVYRLSCGPNCSIGSVSQTPIPGALPLFASGLGVFGAIVWRRRRTTTAA